MGMPAKVTIRRNMRALTTGETSWMGGPEAEEDEGGDGAKDWGAGPVRASRVS